MKLRQFACFLCTISAWASLATTTQAAMMTVNFTDGMYFGLDEVYEEDGFNFTVTGTSLSGAAIEPHSDCGPAVGEAVFGITPFEIYCWHNGGRNNDVERDVTVEQGGAPFDLISLDIVEDIFGQNQVNPDPFTIDFASSAGDLLTVDGNDLRSVNFGWTDITSFVMSVNDAPGCILNTCRHNALIDNVVLNVEPQSVPEPTTAALLALGLLGAGYARKKFRH